MNPPRIEDMDTGDLQARCKLLVEHSGTMLFAYAWLPPGGRGQPELRYVVQETTKAPLCVWRCRPDARGVPSLAALQPLMSWYEREITDMCGLAFENQPQPEPLIFLPGAEMSQPPLDASGREPLLSYRAVPYELPEMSGPDRGDIQQLPFGPVRAGVVESAQFVFFYIGEAILHYHAQLFFKHRGMEKRFEGQSPELAVLLAERVSGVGSVAHALAYSQAVEAAAGCEVPERAQAQRLVLAELERLYNHLHYLAHLSHTTTLKVGEAEGLYLEELAKQINGKICGSRLLRSVIVPGGLRRELSLRNLESELDALHKQISTYTRMLESSTPHLDRLITNGILGGRAAYDQGATGPIERASGRERDLRSDQAYGGYEHWPVRVARAHAGDAHARQQVRIAEIEHSLEVLSHVLNQMPRGPVRSPCVARAHAEGLGWAESPRGGLFYAVHMGPEGRLARVKIKSPSFSNWRVFPFTVHDSNMMDYAINEASFGLTMAGCDR